MRCGRQKSFGGDTEFGSNDDGMIWKDGRKCPKLSGLPCSHRRVLGWRGEGTVVGILEIRSNRCGRPTRKEGLAEASQEISVTVALISKLPRARIC